MKYFLIKFLLGVDCLDFYHETEKRRLRAQIWKPVRIKDSEKIPLVAFDVGLQFRIWDIPLFPAVIAAFGFAVVGTEYRRVEIAKGEVVDIVSAIKHARANFNFIGEKTLLVGVSMGAATMLKIAAQYGSELNVSALVSLGTFADLTRAYYYALAFVKNAMPGDIHASLLNLYVKHIFTSPNLNPQEYVKRSPTNTVPFIECPVMLIHGSKDKIVPVDHSLELYYKMLYLGKEVYLKVVHGEGIHTPLKFFHQLRGANWYGFIRSSYLTVKFLRKYR
jgi:dipeptidyl aminopeptidase/acylaminoacyl peptidase